MARTKSVKEHEDVNIHISKIRLLCIFLIAFCGFMVYTIGDFINCGLDREGNIANVGPMTNGIITTQVFVMGIIWAFLILYLIACMVENRFLKFEDD